MSKFKGYNKVPTSKTMLRIDKRERIISCILGAATLKKIPKEHSKGKDFAKLIIAEHENNKDYFDWKVSLLNKTNWLSNYKTWKEGSIHFAEWKDSRKLRIYYKWIYKSHKKTYKQVLKYMHSPLFAAILLMDNGSINENREILINLDINQGDSVHLLHDWFVDILGLRSEVVKTEISHYLSFDQLSSRKLLSIVKPIIEEIPSMYEKLYPRRELKIG